MILTQRFDSAFLLASELHRNQKRKNIPAPYLAHLMAVASLVCENIERICKDRDLCEDYVITAVLHDAIEDQGGMSAYERIRADFGQRIADNVLLLSHSMPQDLSEREPKSVRNAIYLDKMQSAPPEIILVSCCDKIHNLRTMYMDYLVLGDVFWNAFSQSPCESVNNYVTLGALYDRKLPGDRLITVYYDALFNIRNLLTDC